MTPCTCNRALAVLCGFFASLAACIVLAESACREAGGRVSETAWACATASGSIVPLWSTVSTGSLALAALAVGVPVFLVAGALGRRVIRACGIGEA